jgi:bifunctional enzyme CysN/CysC
MTENMNVVITGHVDHGKSTIIGRLMADTGSLPDGKLEQVKASCARNSKPFEYAFLLDALKDEQSQGITIDSARVFFKTEKRNYIIIDAPGHIEFLKNMVTGAARAEAAFLCIDADEGVQENSRRHGYLLSMLGIRQMCVLVNKMDLVNYDRKVYKQVVRKFSRFLKNINMTDVTFIPVSGMEGDNIASLSGNMSWWNGDTVLTLIDKFQKEKTPDHMDFRMPVQDVYKFTAMGDSRRIIAGTITTGTLRNGDELIFYPSGKKSRVAGIENFTGAKPEEVSAGMATGFTMSEQIYAKRGNLLARAGEKQPQVGNVMRVSLFWLGKEPFIRDKEYILKIGSERVRMRLFDTVKVIDASNLNSDGMKKMVERHDVAECVLTTRQPIAFDIVEDFPETSRFVIVDGYEIAGGGIIREAIRDNKAEYRDKVMDRNLKWDTGIISRERRNLAYGHAPALLIVGGPEDRRKAEFAKKIEEKLFEKGNKVYYLGVQNVLAGLDSGMHIKRRHKYPKDREEMIRRLAELANILVDAGNILVVTVSELTFEEREVFRMTLPNNEVRTIWVGDSEDSDLDADYTIEDISEADRHLEPVIDFLEENGFGHIPFQPTSYQLVSAATGSRRGDESGWTLGFGDEPSSLIRAEYAAKRLTVRENLDGLYRFADWLPIRRTLKGSAVPVTYRSTGLAEELGLSQLWITFNGWWPEKGAGMKTGSFKECEAFSVCARMSQSFRNVLVVASAGNTGRAFARVCSDNDIPLLLFVPKDNLDALWFDEPIRSCVKLVCPDSGGDYFDAIRMSNSAVAGDDRFVAEGGAKNIARRDGMGTTVLSAVTTIGRIPDVYFQAVGSGTGAIAAWEAAMRFQKDGRWGDTTMRLIVSQNAPFTPMVDSWAADSRDFIVPDDETARNLAAGVNAKVLTNRRPPWGVRGGLYDALKAGGGDVVPVSNEEAESAGALFERLEGIDISQAAAVAVASLIKTVDDGRVNRDETIMLNITGGGTQRFRREFNVHGLEPSAVIPLDASDEEIVSVSVGLFENIGQ